MESPPADELLRKIQELEAGHAHMKQEMSKLMQSGTEERKSEQHRHPQRHQRSHSISPQRSRFGAPRRRVGAAGGGGGFDGWASCNRASTAFRHSSPLQRESRSGEPSNAGVGGAGPSALNFTDRQYLNILQSMGQSVHILDLDGRLIYW